MLADFCLTDPLPELAVRSVLVVHGVQVNRRLLKVHVGETKRSVGERIKKHTAEIVNNLSTVTEHHQKTGNEPG